MIPVTVRELAALLGADVRGALDARHPRTPGSTWW